MKKLSIYIMFWAVLLGSMSSQAALPVLPVKSYTAPAGQPVILPFEEILSGAHDPDCEVQYPDPSCYLNIIIADDWVGASSVSLSDSTLTFHTLDGYSGEGQVVLTVTDSPTPDFGNWGTFEWMTVSFVFDVQIGEPLPTATATPTATPEPTPTPPPAEFPPLDPVIAQCGGIPEVNQHIFGHSLINHALSETSPEGSTAVPYWMARLALAADKTYSAQGQYGFLPSPPAVSGWGWEGVTSSWDSAYSSFSQAGLNHILITLTNFAIHAAPTDSFDGGLSPVQAVNETIAWTDSAKPGLTYYLYESWSDMAYVGVTQQPATDTQLANYTALVLGDAHTWWYSLYSQVRADNPNVNFKFMPAGSVLVKLHSQLLQDLPVESMYEDDAPHGTHNAYFLVALMAYMQEYRELPPLTYALPEFIHPEIRNNYGNIVKFIWDDLQSYVDVDGNSVIF